MNTLDMHYNDMAEMDFTLYTNNRRCSSHGLCIERIVKFLMKRIMVAPHSVNLIRAEELLTVYSIIRFIFLHGKIYTSNL
ncbi:hypothetical protein PAEAM_07300 [Paenibacillus sp. GM1FR]|nr:hypothetical protein PAEAM_07300 [Paenibacillus sp. GM1FR]